jgi:hypothetical protein
VTALTERGWPRPRIGGYPIPWISLPDDLGKTSVERREQVIRELRCQVCGEGHEDDDEIVTFSRKQLDGRLWPSDEGFVLPMDDAIMHERCARLAAGSCPALKTLREEDRLLAFTAPFSAVVVIRPSAKEVAEGRIKGIEVDGKLATLAVDGALVEPFEL